MRLVLSRFIGSGRACGLRERGPAACVDLARRSCADASPEWPAADDVHREAARKRERLRARHAARSAEARPSSARVRVEIRRAIGAATRRPLECGAAAPALPAVETQRAFAEEARLFLALGDVAGATPAQLRQAPIAWETKRSPVGRDEGRGVPPAHACRTKGPVGSRMRGSR